MTNNRYALVLVTLAVVVALDQATKWLIDGTMPLHASFPVIDGLFNITYVRNPGAAFGFLAAAPDVFRYVFFLAVTVAAILLILYYLRTNPDSSRATTLALGLILSGAVGNLIDRVRFGEVIDFLDVYIGSAHWPAFNVADSAICVGAGLLMLDLIREYKAKKDV